MELDTKVFKERLKEKRMKLKKRLRAEMGDEPGEEKGLTLGSPGYGTEDGEEESG